MKKLTSLLMVIAIVLLSVFALVACDDPNPDDPTKEKIDTNRTQLYVFNFGGGYGVDWLVAAKKRFEELHKDDVLEDGKKGVQIMITNEKKAMESLATEVLDNKEEVYFTEYAYYYTLKNQNIFTDITDAVKADLSPLGDKAGSTIEGKMTQEQKNYFGQGGSYYAIPHYSGFSGLVYNVDLFEKQGYYFCDYDPSAMTPSTPKEEYFVWSADTKKSAGPDGEYNTSDDGLPATYEEFYILCDYIKQSGDTPIIWNGASHMNYLNNLIEALSADFNGFEQQMITYNLVGEATNLGRVVNGQFVKDAQSTVINNSNAINIFRQEGRYQALSFVETLIDKEYYYQNSSGGSFNTGMSHIDAQDTFLMAGNDPSINNIAMLCEGIWWESEATPTFNEMVSSMGDEFAKKSRNFAFMPLPKATRAQVGEEMVLQDNIYSMCFIKANIADYKKEIAKEFVKFVNTDESLVEYNTITNTPKALNYSMTEEQLDKLTTFGRSVVEMKSNAKMVYPYSSHPVYASHQAQFVCWYMYSSVVNGLETPYPSTAMHDDDVSAIAYFNGMYDYYSKNWAVYFQ